MSDIILTSTELDKNGRKVILDDTILAVSYYDTTEESWDKTGTASQSWHTELSLPSDTFDSSEVIPNKWLILNSKSGNVVSQSGGKLNLEIIKSEAKAALSSEGLWRLTGDFEARLYMDWDSYYNEYRGISDSFITVGYDKENLARLSFSFNGTGYEFRSLKSVNKDPRFFGWTPNGDVVSVDDIGAAGTYEYLKVVKTSGDLSFFIVSATQEVQVGETISESTFGNDLHVEIGIETSQFNTYKHYFSKIFFTGTIEPPTEFFSENRGPSNDFPDKSIITVDVESLSIIDEQDYTLWARFLLGEGGVFPDSNTRVSATNGSLFCATPSGIIAIDFNNDSIYRYRDAGRQLASEPVSMRNSSMSYRVDDDTTGTLPTNSFLEVSSQLIDGTTYIAATADDYTVTIKHLNSGIAYTQEGVGSLSKVTITPAGTLYWAGYDGVTNVGQLSYRTGIVPLMSSPASVEFSRTSYYGTDTAINLLGEKITAFDVFSESGVDLLAVGTTDGLTFIGASPVAEFTGSKTYGVESADSNPFIDPSFEVYLGKYWKPVATGLQKGLFTGVSSDFPGTGSKSLKLSMSEPPSHAFYEVGSYVGVHQDVDLTDISFVYFDSNFVSSGSTSSMWDLEILVGDTVVSTLPGSGAPFTRLSDSFTVIDFSGINTITFRIKVVSEIESFGVSERAMYIDNIRTSIGNPDFRALVPGEVTVSEVLLQYDSSAHKVYYSTSGGYGAIDLYSNSLDFFEPVAGIVPNTSIQSAEFSRDDNEV
jgi:hypothetical protein